MKYSANRGGYFKLCCGQSRIRIRSGTIARRGDGGIMPFSLFGQLYGYQYHRTGKADHCI
ncbi:hypothetical protein [Desulfocicer vacuolatum]|uniref:hypothetical protein n=1 Tax=Desulfocicer vacuolatum TaxID=2298 RepID=UPI001BAEABF9|nr:hypothetical protein [Desulfocicer vacuolatum]